jgi:hypothetical protein
MYHTAAAAAAAAKHEHPSTEQSVATAIAADYTGGTKDQLCHCRTSSMVSYLAGPTPLNTLFRHPGLLYHVEPGSSSSSSSPHQQQWTTAEIVLLAAIDAAR